MSNHNPLELKMLINTLYASVACASLLAISQAAVAGCSSSSSATTTATTTNAATATPSGTPVSVNNPQLAAPKVTTPVIDEKLAGGGGPTLGVAFTTVAR